MMAYNGDTRRTPYFETANLNVRPAGATDNECVSMRDHIRQIF